MDWIVLLHAAATLFMLGLIWFVQVVHYPLYSAVGWEEFREYERRHGLLAGRVVGVPMLLEMVTAVLLLFVAPEGLSAWAWVGLLLLVLIWGSTAFVQVPCHRALERGFDAAIHRRLVRTNWIRTAAWSARGLIALHLVTHEVPGAGGWGFHPHGAVIRPVSSTLLKTVALPSSIPLGLPR